MLTRMRGRCLFCLVVLMLAAVPASAQRAVILVRHAEKVDDSKDAALSPAGLERAARLAVMLKDAGVNAVYSTSYQRTMKTAEPTAKALGVSIRNYGSTDELIPRLRSDHRNDIVLVVGHSNTLPEAVSALGSPDAVHIEDDDYANVIVVVPAGSGPPVVVRLRY